MYTRTGLIIAMTHIQLPFTLLPIYSVMRTIVAVADACGLFAGRAAVRRLSFASICRR